MTETLIPFLLAVLALLIIPGPDMAFVMANGIAYGRRGAFYSALGISSGGLVLAVATALLVAATLAISPSVLLALQLAGCLYLLYVATRTIIPRPGPAGTSAPAPASGNLFLRGVVTNVSNPKALIFFSAFIPQFIPDDATGPALHAFLLGALLCLVGGAVNFAIGASGMLLSGLNRTGFLGRSWSQWIVFAVFVSISVTFTVQALAHG
ncbi:MAG: LysE family translocator [Boseongicola sp.]|nr:LysE family translocator [Boseongicola sp.]